MNQKGMTLVEAVVVVAIICGILVFIGLFSRPLYTPVTDQFMRSCTNNLSQIGRVLFIYESQKMFGVEPTVDPVIASGKENSRTLDPIIAMVSSGLLSKKHLVCPMAEGPPVADNKNSSHVSIESYVEQLKNGKEISLDRTGDGEYATSNYLFTYNYKKRSKSNRIIAGDVAAGGDYEKDLWGGVSAGYSPNHGDREYLEESDLGANVLFADGHVSTSDRETYKVSGSRDTKNIWLNDATNPDGHDPQNVTEDETLIGAYQK